MHLDAWSESVIEYLRTLDQTGALPVNRAREVINPGAILLLTNSSNALLLSPAFKHQSLAVYLSTSGHYRPLEHVVMFHPTLVRRAIRNVFL